MPELFNTSLGVKLTLHQVVQEIMRFMHEDPVRKYKITIGTDSELFASGKADFVSAIVVHRVGNGGRYFWRGCELGKFHTLRDRIIREVLISLELGKELLTALSAEGACPYRSTFGRGPSFGGKNIIMKGKKTIEWDFELHADIGEQGPTKALIQEVVGMIRAHNFEPITKPGSYAASNVADRHV